MKVPNVPTNVLLVGAGLVVVLYLLNKAGQGAVAVAKAINPVDPNNVINKGANATVQALSGDQSNSVSKVLTPTAYDDYDPNAKPGQKGYIGDVAPPEADFFGWLGHTLSPVTYGAPKSPTTTGTTKAK